MLLLLGEDFFQQPTGCGIVVSEPADDLLIGSDHYPLGGEVLIEHPGQVVISESLATGVRALGERGGIKVRLTAKLRDPLGGPHGMLAFLVGMLSELTRYLRAVNAGCGY